MPNQMYVDRARRVYLNMENAVKATTPFGSQADQQWSRALAYRVINQVAGWLEHQAMIDSTVEVANRDISVALAMAMWIAYSEAKGR